MRDREPKRLGGLKVDDQLEFCRLLYREIRRLQMSNGDDLKSLTSRSSIAVNAIWNRETRDHLASPYRPRPRHLED